MDLRDRLFEAYIQHILEHGAPPASVFKFCRDLGISEAEFYQQFASFPALEGQIWGSWIDQTVATISASAEWPSFNARQRMLTFFFAFFERATAKRSYLLARFPCPAQRIQGGAQSLAAMKRRFERFADETLQFGQDRGEVASRGPLSRVYPTAFTELFLTGIDFYLRDESPGFERTDAYVEKATVLAFDLIGNSAIESAVDLVRFVTQRPMAGEGKP